LPGRPDLVFPRYRVTLFVHGCFWHGHDGCRKSSLPTSNVDFWTTKIGKNRERDARSVRSLQEVGWRCITVWECEIESGRVDWDAIADEIRGGIAPGAVRRVRKTMANPVAERLKADDSERSADA
jgi:DNA mismatch endonuclease (patch repair protein)